MSRKQPQGNREGEILLLFAAGISPTKIARALRISPADVAVVTRDLAWQRACRAEEAHLTAREERRNATPPPRRRPRTGDPPGTKSPLADPNHPQVQLVVVLTRRRATLREMGAALGVTRERVRQIRNTIRALHGDALFGDQELYTFADAARSLGVRGNVLRKSANDLNLRTHTGERRCHLLTAAAVERLRTELARRGKRTCVVCGKPFAVAPGGRNTRKTCSTVCWKKRHGEQRHAPADPQKLRGWYRRLWEALEVARRNGPPAAEEWLGHAAARRASGLTNMQLIFLAQRKILTTRANPDRLWRGRPTRLYAKSEILVARRVWVEERERRTAQQRPV